MKKSKFNTRQELKQIYLETPQKLKGKTRNEIISLIGNDYDAESSVGLLVYPIKQNWFSRRKQLLIDFDENGKADTIIYSNIL